MATSRPAVAVSGKSNLPSGFSSHYEPYSWAKPGQLPVVYHPNYNITFFGVEKLHPFDSSKFKKVKVDLVNAGAVKEEQFVPAFRATREQLADVHSEAYLKALESSSFKVAQVTELALLAILPNCLVQPKVVHPMQHHVGGTILAAGLAAQFGWAINLGGGMHHACRDDGMGWCPYDDIYLAVRFLRKAAAGAVQKVLYVDTDAHQGNGVETDKLYFKDNDLCIVDLYNTRAFPGDEPAKKAINIAEELDPGTDDKVYLPRLKAALATVEEEAGQFDLLFYNAGTDPLVGDPLGGLRVSADGIVARDEAVWEFAFQHNIPIVMVLSGGYSKQSSAVISRSILNLFDKFHLASVTTG